MRSNSGSGLLPECSMAATRNNTKEMAHTWQAHGWFLHSGNDPTHTVLSIHQFLVKSKTSVLPQPLYSPDLTLGYLFLVLKLKVSVKGHQFVLVEQM